METNINYAAVGAFVICLIAALVMSIIWLSSGFRFGQHSFYNVYMQESVSGLNIDSPVEFNGVSVGSVKSIDIDEKNPQIVQLLLDVKSSTPITQGTIATLQTRGLTGITFIALKDKSEDLRPLKPEMEDEYPVIRTGPSLFLRLDTALSSLSDNLRDVTVSIRQLLNKENQQSIKEILLNIKEVSNTLAVNNVKMQRIIQNTEAASKDILPMMRATTNTMRMIEMQTLPATNQLISNLNNITRSLNDMASELQQNPAAIVRGVQRQSTGPGETQ
jgi:phospholipid/cholesterol/gamma-HCH transport system substrate-binding protein